ncbi:MAG: type II secretion system F family protein [Firmicutes bacterium]|jgi:tight adherence protein C|nr:type II secretion system F family protein [Bacillota bacterium]
MRDKYRKEMKKFHNKLTERYRRLYGSRGCQEWVRKDKNRFLMKCAAAAGVLLMAIFMSLLPSAGGYNGLDTNKKGEITRIIRPSQEQGALSFRTEVEVDTENGTITKQYDIIIQPKGNGQSQQAQILPAQREEETIENQLRGLISKMNADTSKSKIFLPKELGKGQKLTWKQAEESGLVLYSAAALATGLLLYKTRFYRVERAERQARESIIRELPEFINKIALLLNAGSVLNTAFTKIMEDHGKSGRKQSYFYQQMEQISRSVAEANGSLHDELRSFAKRSGVKELMRITNMISDNISKGADLSDKLKKENEMLWFSRKQNAEEKGRLAETKMTMPLVILLMVLILITIAPAMMKL